MQQKKGLSLATKLNLIIIAAILVTSVGLVGISFKIYYDKVDEIYADRLSDAHEMGNYLVDPSALALLWERAQSDEFAEVRERALEAQDGSIIEGWLESQEVSDALETQDAEQLQGTAASENADNLIGNYKNLYELFNLHASYMDYIESTANVTSAYIQFMEDGVTYTLVDPELGYLGIMETEDAIAEFEGYKDNERVPFTVYKSKYGWLGTMCEPIVDATTGQTVGLLCVDVDMNEVMAERWDFIIQSIALVLAITIVVMALSVYLIQSIATKPIQALTEAAGGFCDLKDDNLEDNIIDIDIRSNDEIGELAHEIHAMQTRIVEYSDNLARVSAEKERTKAEMDMASSIQESMLPNIFPCFPDRAEFDIFASMDTAKEVGGDFYDFFLIDDNRLALVIADVSGKGIPAALFMMSVKIMICDRAKAGGTPAQILTSVNAQICEQNPTKTFVSVWMGILDIVSGKLTCTNAGHLYPFARTASSGFSLLKDKHGLVMGGVKRIKYADYELQLAPGDAIFVYTDGVTEARNAEGTFFGLDALGAALNSRADAAPKELLGTVKDHVLAFIGEAEPFDDLTMLCLEYHGVEDAILLPATVGSISSASAFVSGKLEEFGASPRAKTQVLVAIDEIMSNIAHYAYPEGPGSVAVRFQADARDGMAEITFVDDGIAYNPLEAKEPDTTLAASERKVGGLGVFLVKKTMDELSYERKDGKNILTIKKRIAG